RAADITKQLLAFARKQTIAPKVLGLNETIESMLPMIKRLIGEDIELVWVPDGEAWPVNMDPTQIDQILVNLCVNARDAIENTGKITIETGNIIFDEEYCSDHLGFSAGKYTMIAVSDDGVGMTAEQQGKIFEPFFTTKDSGRGTGLGLSTIYGIVKQNNGFVNVYSEYGKGSTFRVYLPKEDVLQPARPVVKKTEIPSFGKGQTIMVVEDDNVIMELVEMILKNYKYNVISSSTPTQAIALADKYPGKIDLLVTDTVLPEMNGRELANELCKKQADLKVLFMSGYTANVITHRGALDEEINFIAKPFSLVDFAAKVKEVLES
ncbi:MAG: response regulator, partial [Deltaproteobacteria bacterium]|nr:response regulator [Deltaproteobacteria bacterium]